MKDVAEMTFEEAFKELEAAVAKLEEGEMSLEASIELFEWGQALAEHCGHQLDVAELQVRQLLPDGQETDFNKQ